MRNIRLSLFLAAASLSLAIAVAAPAAEGAWRSLFNGVNLDGWAPKIRGAELGDNVLDTFRVEDGLLQVRYNQYTNFGGRFGHLFYREAFSRYRLRLEYRFVGEQCPGGPGWALRNSGVMIHCQPPETMGRDQDFPVSVEVQLLGGLGKGERPTANVCTPGTHIEMNGKLETRHCINSRSPTFHGDQWVTVEIEVDGGRRIVHRVNGQDVMEYARPQYDPGDANAKKLMGGGGLVIERGHISLQAESHPVDFRRIEILELPDSPAR